jgi:hypothetical protein
VKTSEKEKTKRHRQKTIVEQATRVVLSKEMGEVGYIPFQRGSKQEKKAIEMRHETERIDAV